MSDETAAPLSDRPVMQVGIVVEDVERAAREWAALLGLPVPEIIVTDPVEQARTEYEGKRTPARAKLAFLNVGPLALELIEPLDGPSTWQAHLASHGPSLHHLAFETTDMAGKLEQLESLGISLLQRGEYTGGRYAYLDGTKPLGAIVELLENDAGNGNDD